MADVDAPTGVREIHEDRGQRALVGAWGDGILHTRVCTCARKDSDGLFLGSLALGAKMPTKWFWHTTRTNTDPGYPMLYQAGRLLGREGGLDTLELNYLEVKTGTVAGGYGESNRIPEQRQYDILYTVFGVASALDSAGIPSEGDVLDITGTWTVSTAYVIGNIVQGDGTPDSYFYICLQDHTSAAGNEPPSDGGTHWNRVTDEPICYDVVPDDGSMPGRVLVRSSWAKVRNYA